MTGALEPRTVILSLLDVTNRMTSGGRGSKKFGMFFLLFFIVFFFFSCYLARRMENIQIKLARKCRKREISSDFVSKTYTGEKLIIRKKKIPSPTPKEDIQEKALNLR